MRRLLLLLPALLGSGPVPQESLRPNIVYILADDLGYGDIQALNPGRGRIPTPHLDRLVAQGLSFSEAHSGSSVCTPTRYGILTGRYAWRTRLQKGVLDGGNDAPLIEEGRLTVPGFLRKRGYATACIGKWHLGFTTDPPPARGGGAPVGAVVRGGPVDRGFDAFFGCSNARTMSSLIENSRVVEQLEPVEMLPRLARRAAAYVAERAADAKAGKPFFLYLPLTSPHTPIVPAPEWKGRSGLGDYGDFVMQTDAVVGRVLDALDEAGLAGNTLVIFTSDNGCSPAAGTERLERQGHFASEGRRGYKADLWDGGHRVPFLARWPERVKAGTRSSGLVCLGDLLATCADLLGESLPADAGEDSESFLPLLLGREGAKGRKDVVHHSIHGHFAIREGPWKLLLCAGSGGWGKGGGPESPQLYDLSADPAEASNVASAHPDLVERLTRRLERLVEEGRGTPGPPRKNDVPVDLWKRERPR